MAQSEFTILRNGKPILIIVGIFGPTWIDERYGFQQDINKIGANMALLQDGVVISQDRAHIQKLLSHWRKILRRRLKALGSDDLSSIVDTSPFDETTDS